MSGHFKSSKPFKLQNFSNKDNKSSMLIPTEILQKISSHFSEDKSTLFSCILVSRHWCTSLIEVLWAQPFHLSHSSRMIKTYLSFLPETSLDRLKIKNFRSLKEKHKSVFDYPSFLRKLSFPLLCNAIGEFVREEMNITTIPSSTIKLYTVNDVEKIMYTDLLELLSKQKRIQLTPTFTFKLFFEKQNNILRELCKLIYNKINSINNLDFDIGLSQDDDLAVEELMNLQDCFRGLKVLDYSGSSEVLCFFAKHCRKIESLKLFQVTYSGNEHFEKNNLDDDDDPLTQLIIAQKNLRNLEFHNWKIFPSLTITPSNITNSLKSIKLVNCNFCKSKPLWSLSKCRNLEEIIIKENYNFSERLLIPIMKVKFPNLRVFVYQYQLYNFIGGDDFNDDDEDEFIEEETNLDEIFSCIILNAKDSLRTVVINGFKTFQSLRNTLNSLTECRDLINLDITLEKSENILPSLLSIIKHNQSLEKLYIVSDTPNLPNNNFFIDVNHFLHSFVKVLPQNFKLLKMHTPDWWFSTSTLDEFLGQAKFRIESMCWMNYRSNLECSKVLRQYAKLNGCKLSFGEDCVFVHDSLGLLRTNVFFNLITNE